MELAYSAALLFPTRTEPVDELISTGENKRIRERERERARETKEIFNYEIIERERERELT